MSKNRPTPRWTHLCELLTHGLHFRSLALSQVDVLDLGLFVVEVLKGSLSCNLWNADKAAWDSSGSGGPGERCHRTGVA